MPYLNIDDGFDEWPIIDNLSDAEYRSLMHDIHAWSRTNIATQVVQELLDQRLIRRAPQHWLPEWLRTPPSTRYRAKIPPDVRFAVYARDGWTCQHCGTTDGLSLDHIVPWSLGGSDDESNLQTLCIPCNSRKGARA